MPELTDAAGEQRYELNVDGYVAFVTYAREGDRLIFIHTEVPSELQGRGIGSALARSVLSQARSRHLRVEPRCEFIAGFIQRHPEFTDLVAPERREQPLR